MNSKRILTFIFLILLATIGRGTSIPFSPIVRNYVPSDYSGGRQNWSVTQDKEGMMYVGNNRFLLEFDNHSWQRHSMPGKGIVRSVFYSDGRIYCGSYQEFGYFERIGNTMEYHSLSDRIPSVQKLHEEIWNISKEETSGNIVFQSFGALYIYDGKSVRAVNNIMPLNLINIDGNLFSQLINGDFVMLNDGVPTAVIRKKDIPSDIIAAFKYGRGALLCTKDNGCFQYESGKLTHIPTDADSHLSRESMNRATMTKDSCYVLGTISGGIYSIDKKGHLLWSVNVGNELQNNTVLGLFCDEDNNVWAALDDGVSYIENSSGIYIYRPKSQSVGMIYGFLPNGKESYMATNQGVYHFENGEPMLVPGLDEQTWFVKKVGGKVVCGFNDGTYSITKASAEPVSKKGYGTFCIQQDFYKDSSWIFEGTYAYPCLFKVDESGNWEYISVLEKVNQLVRHIETDEMGNVWCEHFKSGIIRVKLSNDRRKVDKVETFNKLGDVSDSLFCVMKINGRVIFTNGKRFFTYDGLREAIVPYDAMDQQLPDATNVHQVVQANDNYYWMITDEKALLVKCGDNSFEVVRTIPFILFGIYLEERASMVYDQLSGDSYLCLNNTMARIRTKKFLSQVRHKEKRISLVSVLATDNSGNSLCIPIRDGVGIAYKYNSIEFLFQYPVYNEFDTEFRFKLKGLSDQWENAGQFLLKKYYGLHFGQYQLITEAVSGNEIISRTTFNFNIKAPWFISWWMICIYLMTLVGIIYLLNNISIWNFKKEQELAIARQEAELAKQIEAQEKKASEERQSQLEADLQTKSKDLAGSIMTIIANNEVLESLNQEIQKQKQAGGHNRKDLDKLQRMIKDSIVSDKDKWELFQSNFDRIHENFFRRLKEEYPSLTSTDLRLCAMLKVNLSTKEIAIMLNLSVRGIESARYRLRKKFNLSEDQSLTDFLLKFR